MSLKNSLQAISYENFITQISLNKFITTFDYLNENNTTDKNSYLLSTAKYNFNDSNNLSFSTRILKYVHNKFYMIYGITLLEFNFSLNYNR